MSRGTFNGALSGHVFDHGAKALQDWHDQRRKDEEYETRVGLWIARTLKGQRFTSLDSLREAAHTAAVATGQEITEYKRDAINRACLGLFWGLVDRRRFTGKILVTRGEGIRFLAA